MKLVQGRIRLVIAKPRPCPIRQQDDTVQQRHDANEEPDAQRLTLTCTLCHKCLSKKVVLEEDDIECKKDNTDNACPEDWFVPDRRRTIIGYYRCAVDEAPEFLICL